MHLKHTNCGNSDIIVIVTCSICSCPLYRNGRNQIRLECFTCFIYIFTSKEQVGACFLCILFRKFVTLGYVGDEENALDAEKIAEIIYNYFKPLGC